MKKGQRCVEKTGLGPDYGGTGDLNFYVKESVLSAKKRYLLASEPCRDKIDRYFRGWVF